MPKRQPTEASGCSASSLLKDLLAKRSGEVERSDSGVIGDIRTVDEQLVAADGIDVECVTGQEHACINSL